MTIPPQLEEKAALYVLGMLEGSERVAFVQQLESDAELRALVDEFQEALGLYAAASSQPRAPGEDVIAGILQRVEGPGTAPVAAAAAAVGEAGEAPPRQVAVSRVTAWFWPLAALLMLGINFFLMNELWEARTAGAGDERFVRLDRSVVEEHGMPTETGALGVYLESLQGERDRMRVTLDSGREFADVAESRIQMLESSNESLAAERDSVLAALDDLSERAAPLLGKHPGYARYTVMELLSADYHEAGRSSLGLAQWAGSLLQTPGIARPDHEIFGGDVPQPDALAGMDPAEIPLERASFALSIFDEATGRGFLDLYNVPELEEGQSFHLWLRASIGSVGFVAVGGLPPDLAGRSGSVFFEVPPGSISPVEIIITAEDNAEAVEPEGSVILRGP